MEGETIIPQKKKRRRGMIAKLQSNWRNESGKKYKMHDIIKQLKDIQIKEDVIL